MTFPGDDIVDFVRACGVPAEAADRLGDLSRLYRDLVSANRRTNLTRLTGEEEFWVKHVADSLTLGRVCPGLGEHPWAVVDVGAGAGFPSLPLAWAYPSLRVTAVEVRQQKIAFLERQVEALGLSNCRVVGRQAREAARLPGCRGRFDLVTARAVSDAGTLIREGRGFLRPENAGMAFYKTPDAVAREWHTAEREAGKFGFRLETSEPFELPQGGGSRQFLLVSADS